MPAGIRTLVVGVDFSKYSDLVVKEAQALSRKLKIPTVYVYVVEAAYFGEPAGVQQPDMIEHYQNAVRKRYRLSNPTEIRIQFGRPFEELTSIAKGKKSPMIIVGHRGQNAIARFFLGSTAERAALLSPFPVWVHRGNETVIPKKIMVPCDLSSRSKKTIQGISHLVKKLNAKTELLYVIQEPLPVLDSHFYALMYNELIEVEKSKVAAFRRKYPALKAIRSLGGVAFQIQSRAKKSDLIVVSPRSEHESAPYFGSVTTKLIRSGDKPVLVMP